jgi:hypothetical protein
MNTRQNACYLLEADGTLLSSARCRLARAGDGWTALLTGFDAPGRVVQRCLLDQVREVWVAVDEGLACPAQVDRVYFDAARGRACRLRLDTGAAMLLAGALAKRASPSPDRTQPAIAAEPLRMPVA